MKNFTALIVLLAFIGSCKDEKKQVAYSPFSYKIFFGETEAGYFKSSKNDNGAFQFVFEFNDRGRGPHLEETIYLNKQGIIENLQITGHNYLKDSVSESFGLTKDQAIWNSTAENGTVIPEGEAYFVGMNSSFGNTELLVNKMLANPDMSINLYPSGTAKITNVENIQVNDTLKLKLIEFTGFSFTPSYIWFDMNNRFFASPSTWLTCVKNGYEAFTQQLLDIQTQKEKDYYSKLVNELTEKPSGKILIKNVNVFDADKGILLNNKNVVVNGDKIESILAINEALPEISKTIDGTNKTLLPGLFDMHTHLSRSDGILNLAAGVTSVRDLANSFDLPEIRDEFNDNKVLGPRILIMSGFIDQAGPYAGPIGKIVKTLDEGLESIDFYKERGYHQIKLYSSIDPKWVKPLASKAHQLGMKVSGHIPAYMIAEQAIADGYDEIQHVNMLALNFMSDTIDTRTPLRFSMIGKHAHEIDLQGDAFKNFVKLMKDKNIVSDPTVSIFEGMLTTKAGEPDPQFETILDRLPIQVKRGFYSGGLPIPEGMEAQYKNSFTKLLNIIYELYRSGVTIVPGTDAMSGFALHKELENYVRAGIPNAEVLKMATLSSARVVGYEDRLGNIETGKLADLILVDGNPLEDMSHIRRVELTIKNGNIYDSAKLYEAIGVKHFK